MSARLLLIGLSLTIAGIVFPAHAQSFNCHQSGLNLTEHAICQSGDLSGRDEELNRLWNRLKASDRRSMKNGQRRWRANRDSCGSNHQCILENYDIRIADIQETFDNNAGRNTNQRPQGHSGSQAQSLGGNVRSGAGRNYRKLAALWEGESVTLIENAGNVFNGYPWFRIRFRGGKTGYQWGGILCSVGFVNNGVYQQCNHRNAGSGGGVQPTVPQSQPSSVPSQRRLVASSGANRTVTRFSLYNDSRDDITVNWIDGNFNESHAGGGQPGHWTHPGQSWLVVNGGKTWESHWFSIHDRTGFRCSFSPRQGANITLSELSACR